MSKSSYFFCYNPSLSKYLSDKGVRYITKAKHPVSDQLFTLYEQSEELNKHIKSYKGGANIS